MHATSVRESCDVAGAAHMPHASCCRGRDPRRGGRRESVLLLLKLLVLKLLLLKLLVLMVLLLLLLLLLKVMMVLMQGGHRHASVIIIRIVIIAGLEIAISLVIFHFIRHNMIAASMPCGASIPDGRVHTLADEALQRDRSVKCHLVDFREARLLDVTSRFIIMVIIIIIMVTDM